MAVVKTVLGSHFGGVFGEFTTHVRTYLVGIESDVHWGYGILAIWLGFG